MASNTGIQCYTPSFTAGSLLSEDKSKEAKEFFIKRACGLAKDFTCKVKADGGYEATTLPGELLTNAHYLPVYEYIHCSNWNGQFKGRAPTPSNLLGRLLLTISSFGDEELQELDEMIKREQSRRE